MEFPRGMWRLSHPHFSVASSPVNPPFRIIEQLVDTMATSMYVIDNPRRAKARNETNPFAISKYVRLEELIPMEEQDGCAPIKRTGRRDGCKIWRTRRRADNKVSEHGEMRCYALE